MAYARPSAEHAGALRGQTLDPWATSQDAGRGSCPPSESRDAPCQGGSARHDPGVAATGSSGSPTTAGDGQRRLRTGSEPTGGGGPRGGGGGGGPADRDAPP